METTLKTPIGERQRSRSTARILLVNQHYPPDMAPSGHFLMDVAEHLAGRSYEVEVLTSRGNYLAGRTAAPRRETRNGVRIRRVSASSFGRARHVGRMLDYLTFLLRVAAAILFGPRRDGVLFLTTPPLLSVVGRVAFLFRGQRYGIWSMDLHPDAAIASGMLRDRTRFAQVLEWANAAAYRKADFVIDLGRYMNDRIRAKGVSARRCYTIPLWCSKDEIYPIARERNPLIDQLGLRDKFVVMYAGNAGIVHDFKDICEAMRILRDDPQIYFLFVGGGPRRREIEAFVRDHSIENFQYRGYFERDQLRYSLGAADVHLIALRGEFVGISVPNKLFGVMAAARPGILIGPRCCESAETILARGCGAVIDPAHPGATDILVQTLRDWSRDRSVPEALGRAGREAFLSTFEKRLGCEQVGRVLDLTWSAGRARGVARQERAVTTTANLRTEAEMRVYASAEQTPTAGGAPPNACARIAGSSRDDAHTAR
jgi:glycosyltransferase involved in cell wall biosynthesis